MGLDAVFCMRSVGMRSVGSDSGLMDAMMLWAKVVMRHGTAVSLSCLRLLDV